MPMLVDDVTDLRSDIFIAGMFSLDHTGHEKSLNELVHQLFHPQQIGLETSEEDDKAT
jgi:hypothetical protein